MCEDFDVVVIGGAFSGAATATLLRRECPGLRVAIVERAATFDRKVGEATTEVSGSFLTKRLALTSHLNNHHLAKQGLRFWFTTADNADFGRCGELGGYFQSRLPAYQVDRQVLDEHMLNVAREEGAVLLRPAKILRVEPGKSVTVDSGGSEKTIRARWTVDASGRAALLARQFGLLQPLKEHPTNAIWARFRNVGDLDGHSLRSRHPEYARACQSSRTAATNHLTGYGWWCWIIPLKGGFTSVGLVYDQRFFTPPAADRLVDRLHNHLLAHPVGHELFANASAVEGDVKAYSSLPYYSRQIAGPGWQIVGDAAGFLDPLYSAGLDYCSWTVSSAVNRILSEYAGHAVDLADINSRFARSYRSWFNALYRDKYTYLGDAELMRAAFLMDLGLWFFGPVRELCTCPKGGLERFPFDGPGDGLVSKFMAFYNRRLSKIAEKRRAANCYGASNLDHRTLVRGLDPTPKVLALVRQGIVCWLKAEVRSAFLHPEKAPLEKPHPIAPVGATV